MINRRALVSLTLATLVAGINSPARAGDIVEPRRGSALRKTLLDTLRPHIETEMRVPVEFVVRTMKVSDGFAFLVVDPQQPGGIPIDPAKTVYRDELDFMDGLTVYALLKKSGDRWIMLEQFTGPTDAVFVEWPSMFGAPKALFGM